jgi:hypothetical protein
MARIVRGQTLSLKRREFIEAAHACGVTNHRLVFRHIIPNLAGPVVVFMTLLVPKVILFESFLSFLGLGVQEPMTSWGVLISEGEALMKLSTGEVSVKVISSGVGGLTESDVMLAAASKAQIIAFNIRADAAAREALRDQNVEVRYYSIIYEAIDDIRVALTGMLVPEVKEQIVGLAEVRDVFRSSKFGTVAGCLVVDGYVRRNNPIRVLRDNVVIFQGELESLKRFKDDASEVRAGTECGIGVKGYNDVKVGDQIECFERVEVARQL